MIIKKLITYLLIYIFSSLLISFKIISCNFNEYVFHLSFAFIAFIGSAATSGSVASSGVGSSVEISSIFFVGNNLMLKLLRTFSLALSNNTKSFKKDFFQMFLYLFQNSLIHQQNYFACYQLCLLINGLLIYLLKKQQVVYIYQNYKFFHVLIYNLDNLF